MRGIVPKHYHQQECWKSHWTISRFFKFKIVIYFILKISSCKVCPKTFPPYRRVKLHIGRYQEVLELKCDIFFNGIILKKILTSVPSVRLIIVLYQKFYFCEGNTIEWVSRVCLCSNFVINLHGVQISNNYPIISSADCTVPQLVHISSDITVLRADLGHSEIILCDMKTKVNRTSKRQDPKKM